MDIRQKAYWLRQADAIERQRTALIAHGVGIGMADVKDGQKALDSLELIETKEDSREKRVDATWDMLMGFGGSKGV